MTPTPNFTIPPYDPNDKRNWLQRVIGLLSGSPYFSSLLDETNTKLVSIVLEDAVAADATLCSRLIKAMTKEQLTIITGDSDKSATKISGIAILHCIDRKANIKLTQNQAFLKWKELQNIKLGAKEQLASYMSRVLQAAKELDNTDYKQSTVQRNMIWRHGLGPTFDYINDSIDILGIVPKGWGMDNISPSY